MEELTLACMQHLQTAVVYVIDLSGTCGPKSTVLEQLLARSEVKKLFGHRPWIDVVSKSDLPFCQSSLGLRPLCSRRGAGGGAAATSVQSGGFHKSGGVRSGDSAGGGGGGGDGAPYMARPPPTFYDGEGVEFTVKEMARAVRRQARAQSLLATSAQLGPGAAECDSEGGGAEGGGGGGRGEGEQWGVDEAADIALCHSLGVPDALRVSVHDGGGMDALRASINALLEGTQYYYAEAGEEEEEGQ
jgi:hypothetical protein